MLLEQLLEALDRQSKSSSDEVITQLRRNEGGQGLCTDVQPLLLVLRSMLGSLLGLPLESLPKPLLEAQLEAQLEVLIHVCLCNHVFQKVAVR
jgi:hypothetical protein